MKILVNLQKQVTELKYKKKANKIELLHQNANVADPNVEQLCSSLQASDYSMFFVYTRARCGSNCTSVLPCHYYLPT